MHSGKCTTAVPCHSISCVPSPEGAAAPRTRPKSASGALRGRIIERQMREHDKGKRLIGEAQSLGW
eukprot:3355863-Alexandrium_andersonii.AAC.1